MDIALGHVAILIIFAPAFAEVTLLLKYAGAWFRSTKALLCEFSDIFYL